MKRKTILPLLLFLLPPLFLTDAAAQGLRFRGMDYPIDERTSMRIRLPGAFHESLVMDFDVAFTKEEDAGYIFRLGKSSDEAQPEGICLFFDSMSPVYMFRVIWEGHRFVSSVELPKEEVPDGQWLHIRFKMAPKLDSLYLQVGSHVVAGALELDDRIRPFINFGKNEYRIDVPSFDLRNLRITADGRQVFFPLTEDSGNIAASTSPLVRGKVTHPVWLSQESFRWRKVFSYASDRLLTAGYDERRHETYLISRDSLILYPVGREKPSTLRLAGQNPVRTFLGSSFPDPAGRGYYCYEVYYDGSVDNGTPTLSFLDRASRSWTAVTTHQFPTQLHHHNLLVDTLRHRALLYGGFGNRKYNGDFYRFDLDSLAWSAAPPLSGDPVWPRYFASMGQDPRTGDIYLFGGMGNESGDHIVGRQYLRDLYRIDPETLEARRCWTLPTEGTGRVPVRNMVLPGDGSFYTLYYPESLTETELLLERFSLRDGQVETFADPVPMNSDRILTNANLYFDRTLEKLVAVLEETLDDRSSTVTVFTLAFPPGNRGLPTVVRRHLRRGGIAALLLLVAAALSWRTVRRALRRRRLRASIPVTALESSRPEPDSILLFGGFTAIDSNGRDVSAEFTEKIRQLFYVILQSGEAGISSRRIRALLWPDKDEDKAKNLRGVTMNKLRKALSLLDGVSINYEDNHFRLVTEPRFHCDWLDFHRIIESDRPDMDALIRLLSRGKFLLGESDPIFDKMKEDVEQRIDPVLHAEMKRRFELREYPNAILCADILFQTDPLDEDALSCKVRALRLMSRENDARSCYHAFVSQYKKEYDEDYGRRFESIV